MRIRHRLPFLFLILGLWLIFRSIDYFVFVRTENLKQVLFGTLTLNQRQFVGRLESYQQLDESCTLSVKRCNGKLIMLEAYPASPYWIDRMDKLVGQDLLFPDDVNFEHNTVYTFFHSH
jgi:hypothetical protein